MTRGGGFVVAVIGLGYFSQFHLRAWQDDPRVARVAATDIDPARRAWAENEFQIDVYDDLDGLLAGLEPDIVDIVAPPPAHSALVSATAQAGRVVICQKPFCTSLEEAEAVTANAKGDLIIHENFRFQPWYRTLRRLLDTGDLGNVYQARFALRPGDGRGPDAYLARQPAFQTMPRLLIHETGVHFIDLFTWLFGPIRAVYADLVRLNPSIEGEDAGLLLLDHESGVRSQFDGNRLSDHATDNPRRTMGEFWVEGERGVLHIDGQGRIWRRAFGQANSEQIPLDREIDDNSFGGGCVATLCSHVLDALEGKFMLENRAADYLPVIRATEAAYRSAASGQKINLDNRGNI